MAGAIVYVALLTMFVAVGMTVVCGLMYALASWVDRECVRCLREEPDNDYCCE